MLQILAFEISHVACISVFGVLNVKNLAFSTKKYFLFLSFGLYHSIIRMV